MVNYTVNLEDNEMFWPPMPGGDGVF